MWGRLLGSIVLYAMLAGLAVCPPALGATLTNTAVLVATGESATVNVVVISDDTPQDPDTNTNTNGNENTNTNENENGNANQNENRNDNRNENKNTNENVEIVPPVGSDDGTGTGINANENANTAAPPSVDTDDDRRSNSEEITGGFNLPPWDYSANVPGGLGNNTIIDSGVASSGASRPSQDPMAQTGDKLAVLGVVLAVISAAAFAVIWVAKRRKFK